MIWSSAVALRLAKAGSMCHVLKDAIVMYRKQKPTLSVHAPKGGHCSSKHDSAIATAVAMAGG